MTRLRTFLVGALVTLATATGTPGIASAGGTKEPVPTVTGPVTGGKGSASLVTTTFDLAEVGYVSEEYFLEGTARSFTPEGTFGTDGEWPVEELDATPYKTRFVVYRPEDPKKFNGTVVVEWMNVSSGFDVAVDWTGTHTQLIHDGAAYVGVSAQSIGVQGGGAVLGGSQTGGGIKGSDPERYSTLSHPGDVFSYDIFTQAGVAAAGRAEGDAPLGGLDVERVLADGESQSAGRMVTYVNAIQPVFEVFDGFLIHSRGPSGASLGVAMRGVPDPALPEFANIRQDGDAPVIVLQTESDVLRSLPARQRDGKRFRWWEAAGTSHVDQYTAGIVGFGDVGDGEAERTLLDPASINGGVLGCGTPINSGPGFAVLSAAARHLDRWVRDGTAPPKAAFIDIAEGDVAAAPVIERDEHGIALSGIRTPLVDAPAIALTGKPNEGGPFCTLYGTSTPLDAATLAALYPTHDDYVREFRAATKRAVDAGFVLKFHGRNFDAAAAESSIGA